MQRAKQISESIELGAILALAGGFMDAYSYIGRGGVFANAQTRNILLVGIHLSLGEFSQALRFLLPVVSFALGIMLSDLIHERFSSPFHWRQVTVFLEAVILFCVSFISGDLNLPANCLTSFACGMQVESFRKIHGKGVATTMCIGNLRSGLQNVDDYIITHNRGFLENGVLYLASFCALCWVPCWATGASSILAFTRLRLRQPCWRWLLPSCLSIANIRMGRRVSSLLPSRGRWRCV